MENYLISLFSLFGIFCVAFGMFIRDKQRMAIEEPETSDEDFNEVDDYPYDEEIYRLIKLRNDQQIKISLN